MLDLTSISFIILAMNYIALAGVFLLRYFNPKQWSIWLVKSSASYFVVYTITMFVLLTMFFVILLLPEIKLLDPSIFIFLILLGFLFLILVAVKKQIENIEGNIISPFLLYLFSVGQEIFYTVTSNDGMVLLLILIFWYFVGAFVILLLGKIIGYLLGKLMPKIAKEHMKIMKSKFGNKAPEIIKFDDGSVMTGFGPTAEFAGMGVAFAIWMISRHFLFEFFIPL